MLLGYNQNMEKIGKQRKTFDEKENDHKHLNKKSGLLSSLNFKPILNSYPDKINLRSTSYTSNIPISYLPNIPFILPSNPTLQNNTFNFCKIYSKDLQDYYQYNQQTPELFLQYHDVTNSLRARMLDWMVEVTESYKFKPKTYFCGVEIMDQYFLNQTQKITVDKLHLIGVVSMFIASKMEEVFPFRLKTVYEKIVHKKISIKDIIETESQVFKKLKFNFVISTFFDRIMLQIFTKSTLDYLKNNEDSLLLNQKILLQIEQLCSYISKFVCYNYEIVSRFHKNIICDAVLGLSLQMMKINIFGVIHNVENLSEVEDCKNMLITTISTFRKVYKGLNNIYKFSKEGLVKNVDDYFQVFV